MMNLVGERMTTLVLEIVIQIMNMQVSVRETLSGRNVEIADDLVNTDSTLETASLFALFVKMLGVVFSFALFDTFAAAEGP